MLIIIFLVNNVRTNAKTIVRSHLVYSHARLRFLFTLCGPEAAGGSFCCDWLKRNVCYCRFRPQQIPSFVPGSTQAAKRLSFRRQIQK